MEERNLKIEDHVIYGPLQARNLKMGVTTYMLHVSRKEKIANTGTVFKV